MRVDICCDMVSLVQDRDDSVKVRSQAFCVVRTHIAKQDLAVTTLADMLYPIDPKSNSSARFASLLVDMVCDYKGSIADLELALGAVSTELGLAAEIVGGG